MRHVKSGRGRRWGRKPRVSAVRGVLRRFLVFRSARRRVRGDGAAAVLGQAMMGVMAAIKMVIWRNLTAGSEWGASCARRDSERVSRHATWFYMAPPTPSLLPPFFCAGPRAHALARIVKWD